MLEQHYLIDVWTDLHMPLTVFISCGSRLGLPECVSSSSVVCSSCLADSSMVFNKEVVTKYSHNFVYVIKSIRGIM